MGIFAKVCYVVCVCCGITIVCTAVIARSAIAINEMMKEG